MEPKQGPGHSNHHTVLPHCWSRTSVFLLVKYSLDSEPSYKELVIVEAEEKKVSEHNSVLAFLNKSSVGTLHTIRCVTSSQYASYSRDMYII